MNKKGFTLIELLVTIILIAVIMTLVLPAAFKTSQKNKIKLYHEYENMMVEYARVNPLNVEETIDLEDLEELDRVKAECIGYVLINHATTPEQYQAYISCGNQYETEGFDEEFKASKGLT